MKRLWIAAALLGVMLAGSLTNAWYAQSMTEGFNRRLEQAQTLAREGIVRQKSPMRSMRTGRAVTFIFTPSCAIRTPTKF